MDTTVCALCARVSNGQTTRWNHDGRIHIRNVRRRRRILCGSGSEANGRGVYSVWSSLFDGGSCDLCHSRVWSVVRGLPCSCWRAQMNCPHCQKPLPEKYGATYCLHCGVALPPQEPPVITSAAPLPPVKISWLLFFGALLAPPLLTFLAAFVLRDQTSEQAAPWIAIVGAAAGGVVCGIMLGLRFGNSVSWRFGLSLLLSCLMVLVCFILSFGGCMVGGYKISF